MAHHAGTQHRTVETRWLKTHGPRRPTATPLPGSLLEHPRAKPIYKVANRIYDRASISPSDYDLTNVLYIPKDAWVMRKKTYDACLNCAATIFEQRLLNNDGNQPKGIDWRREIVHKLHGMEAAVTSAEEMDISASFQTAMAQVRRKNIKNITQLILTQSAVEVATAALLMSNGAHSPPTENIPDDLAAEFTKCIQLIGQRKTLDIAIATYRDMEDTPNPCFSAAVRAATNATGLWPIITMDSNHRFRQPGQTTPPRRTYTARSYVRGRAAEVTRSARRDRRTDGTSVWLL